MFLTGATASVVRACIMSILGLMSFLFYRKYNSLLNLYFYIFYDNLFFNVYNVSKANSLTKKAIFVIINFIICKFLEVSK